MNTIVETRNGGEGWWAKQQSGNKLGMLVIAPRVEDIALDALVQSSIGEKQHVGVVVVHSQDGIERAEAWADEEQRLYELGAITSSSFARMFTQFPIGSLTGNSNRASDFAGYNKPEQGVAPIEQELALTLRALRPDVVIIAGKDSGSPLVSRCTSAALYAIQLAGDPRFKISPNDPFFDLPSWRVQRTITRTPRRTSSSLADWSIEPSSILGESGQTVADRVRVASGLLDGAWHTDQLYDRNASAGIDTKLQGQDAIAWNRLDLYGDYWNRSGNRRTNMQQSSYHAGILQNDGSKRPIADLKIRNLQVLMASMKLGKAFNDLTIAERSNDSQKKKWLQDLQTYLSTLPLDDRGRVLLELSLVFLNRGDWEAWELCHSFAVQEPKATLWREIAHGVATQFALSEEVTHAFGTAHQDEAGRIAGTSAAQTLIQPAAFVSPFEIANQSATPVGSTSSASQQASSTTKTLSEENASVRSASYDQKLAISASSITTVPQESQNASPTAKANSNSNRTFTALQKAAPNIANDPRVVLAMSSFERRMMSTVPSKHEAGLRTLSLSTALMGWSG